MVAEIFNFVLCHAIPVTHPNGAIKINNNSAFLEKIKSDRLLASNPTTFYQNIFKSNQFPFITKVLSTMLEVVGCPPRWPLHTFLPITRNFDGE